MTEMKMEMSCTNVQPWMPKREKRGFWSDRINLNHKGTNSLSILDGILSGRKYSY